jgi:hypothetical protein
MVHHDVKIDVTKYSQGQREESQHYDRKALVTRLTNERIMIGSNTDGISFNCYDLAKAIELLDQTAGDE